MQRLIRSFCLGLLALTASAASAGGLTAQQINAVIDEHGRIVRACYEDALKADPSTGTGQLRVSFRVSPKGKVVAVGFQGSTIKSGKVETCVNRQYFSWVFPLAADGRETSWTHTYDWQATPAAGGLSEREVTAVLDQHGSEIHACYEEGRAADPKLAGVLKVHFRVAASGKVVAVGFEGSTLNNGKVETCVNRQYASWVFPATHDERETSWDHIYDFRP